MSLSCDGCFQTFSGRGLATHWWKTKKPACIAAANIAEREEEEEEEDFQAQPQEIPPRPVTSVRKVRFQLPDETTESHSEASDFYGTYRPEDFEREGTPLVEIDERDDIVMLSTDELRGSDGDQDEGSNEGSEGSVDDEDLDGDNDSDTGPQNEEEDAFDDDILHNIWEGREEIPVLEDQDDDDLLDDELEEDTDVTSCDNGEHDAGNPTLQVGSSNHTESNANDLEGPSGRVDPVTGRLLIEAHLRQKVFIEQYPGGLAGAAVEESEHYDTTSGYRRYHNDVNKQQASPTDNTYAPFKSRLDWEVARWAKLRGPSSTAFTELLDIDGVQEALGLSYKNSRELNVIVDSLLPAVRPRFRRSQVIIDDEVHILYYRDVMDCIKSLFGAAEFAQHLVFAPEAHYTDETKSTRLYHDMHTGKWWWWTQTQLEQERPGATIIPIILSSDKTQITQFSGKSAYPVYLTIGNLPKEIRRKPSWNGHILLAYLPIASFEHVTNQASRRRMTGNLFHACMRKILKPLVKAGTDGIPMLSGDGLTRHTYPIVAAYGCDYLEQVTVTGVKTGECPSCPVPHSELGNYDLKYATAIRDLHKISEALKAYDSNPSSFTKKCREAGIKPIVHPFWEDLPHCNIFCCITPDILHQLYQGLIKHLVAWLKSAYSKQELDARVRRLPPNHHVRQFLRGITHLNRLTGKEHGDIARVLLGLVIDLPLPGTSSVQLVKAVRAILDFLYLAQYPVHSTETLNLLQKALHDFHENKSIFEKIGVRDSWEIPKLHFALHYLVLIKWLGTPDNFDTQYTERLHIDLAKDAYEATNHKDEFAQMTLWLERKEKIIKHASYIHWRLAGSPANPVKLASLHIHPPRIRMTKHPTCKNVQWKVLAQDYGASFIQTALARYIVQWDNPGLSPAQIEEKANFVHMPFGGLAVYHRMKIWLGDAEHHKLLADENDVIHARPARKDKYGRVIAGRFDIALIDDGTGSYQGLNGYQVGQVRVIFSLPNRGISRLYLENKKPPQHLAYVEWFKLDSRPQPHHLLYRTQRAYNSNGDRLASVIPLDRIRRSLHLFPAFGKAVPSDWQFDNVLDRCDAFYINSFSDRHSYHTLV